MSDKFVFRTGKYAGKTLEWVQKNNPMYLMWVKENQPNMLKETKGKPKVVSTPPADKKKILPEKGPETLAPNINFFNEPPDEQSLKYFNKTKGINVDKMNEVVEKHKTINKLFEEGKEIPSELTKDFITFPITNNPKIQDYEWNF